MAAQPHNLRDRLTEREIDAYRHPLVRFVGLDTYEREGGGIRRDLFAEGDKGVSDRCRAAGTAGAGQAGGHRRRSAGRRLGVGGCHAGHDPCRLASLPACAEERRSPNKRDAQRIEKLQTKMHELAEAVDAALDADDEEKADALQEEGERLGEQLQALEDGLLDYAANVKAAAGAIVSIDRDGLAVIHRGLLREAEAKALRTLERLQQRFGSEGEAGNDDEGENGYDDRQPRPPPCPTDWPSG